jgi:hypothetical protein
MGFLSTTFKLWMEVPGYPPLWLCGLVAFMVSKAQQEKAKMGSIYIDHDVDSDHHAPDA